MASFTINTPSWTAQRLAVMLAAGMVLLASFYASTPRLEPLLPALAARFMPLAATSTSVAVIGIDAPSLEAYGVWPWPREQLATVVQRLRESQPGALGLLLPLHTAHTPVAIHTLQTEVETLDKPLRRQARTWLQRADPDAKLAHALQQLNPLVLSASYTVDATKMPALSLPASALTVQQTTQPWQTRAWQQLLSPPKPATIAVSPPLPLFISQHTSLGLSLNDDRQRTVYGTPLALTGDGQYLPGFELALLAAYQGTHKPAVIPGVGIKVSPKTRITSPDLVYYPRPAEPVPIYSLQTLMQNDKLVRRLRNHIILLGLTAPGLAPELTGPTGRRYSPVTWSAQVVDSLLDGRAFFMPTWFYGAQRALLLLFALYLLVFPSAWHRLRAPIISGVLAVLALNAGLIMLIVQQRWLPVVTPTVFLMCVQLFLSFSSRRQAAVMTARQQLVEARVALGKQLQSQGQLELAMDQFAPCLPAPAALDSAYELGLEHERRRQVQKAQAIFAKLAIAAKAYKDTAQRSRRLADLSARFPGADAPAANATLVLDDPVMELPVLGRYRLERELGHGAMGTVYLATDPTIGRQVAIKTLSLLEHYEAPEQAAVVQRFLKEAEAVGRLAHPNIVSIHDAGQEHDLAYMTMDFVDGDSLDAWVDKSSLLPAWEVLDIAAQVADALDYAHSRQVIHRDIKPGNIIYDRDSGTVKMTDFGVARILDSKRTRTGTVLGTPSYMSPEQVAGRKIDGQSDLFSLGVTLFQLLTGHLPFSGDSIATLMYQIANQKTPSLRQYRRGLPVCISRLLNRSLQKAPAKRFVGGAEMALAIRKCRAQFKGGRRKTA